MLVSDSFRRTNGQVRFLGALCVKIIAVERVKRRNPAVVDSGVDALVVAAGMEPGTAAFLV